MRSDPTLGHVGLQAQTQLSLGRIYYDTGDYTRAVASLERNVAMLQGDLRYEHFGANNSIAAASRSWLSYCHAERGAFTEGRALAEEGLRIAETVNRPFGLIEACQGVSALYLRQGDVQRAIPVLERAVGLCQDWPIPLLLPVMTAVLGLAYAMEGRVAEGLILVEQGVEQQVARSRQRELASAIICLSEAYLLAGRLEDAHQRAAQAVDSPVSISNAATRPGRCGSSARARRARHPARASLPSATTTKRSPWPRSWVCARCKRTATGVWVYCMPPPASRSKRAPSCRRRSRCIRPWR